VWGGGGVWVGGGGGGGGGVGGGGGGGGGGGWGGGGVWKKGEENDWPIDLVLFIRWEEVSTIISEGRVGFRKKKGGHSQTFSLLAGRRERKKGGGSL